MEFYLCNVTDRVVCASKQFPFALVALDRTQRKMFLYINLYCHGLLRKYNFNKILYVYLFYDN